MSGMTLLTCGMMTSMFSVPRSAMATLSVPPDVWPELVGAAGLDAAAPAGVVGAAAAGAVPPAAPVVAAGAWLVDGAGCPHATSNPATIKRLEIHPVRRCRMTRDLVDCYTAFTRAAQSQFVLPSSHPLTRPVGQRLARSPPWTSNLSLLGDRRNRLKDPISWALGAASHHGR